MSGRAATTRVQPGRSALSIGLPELDPPSGWKWVKLSDVARLESGHTPSRRHPEYWDGDVAWIGIKDARLAHGETIESTLQRVTDAGLANSAARLLPAGTVCLSRTASVGYCTIMGRPMATSQDFVNWVCSSAIDPKFLQQLFIAEKESLLDFGKGTTHKTIYYPEVKAFHVCLPPLDEQRRIVAKIEALFARSRRAKEALDAIPPLLERLRQSILAAAFRGDLTADWRAQNPDVEPAEKLLERIRIERRRRWEEGQLAKMRAKGKEPKGDGWKRKYKEPVGPRDVGGIGLSVLPSTWRVTSLASATSSITSGSRAWSKYYDSGKGTFILAKNVRPGRLDFSERQRIGPPDGDPDAIRSQVQVGDLLVTIVGVKSGDICVVESELPEHYVCQSVALLRPVIPVFSKIWMYFFQSSQHGGAQFEAYRYGDDKIHISFDQLRQSWLYIMPTAEATVLVSRIESALSFVTKLEKNLSCCRERVEELEKSVLAEAFAGRLVAVRPRGLASVEQERTAGGAVDWADRDHPLPVAVRPTLPNPADYTLDDWRTCLLHVTPTTPIPRDEAITAAAHWARDNYGLTFKRLPANGKIIKGLKSAMNSAIRRGELQREGTKNVRRVVDEG